jgi:hypothetical protein
MFRMTLLFSFIFFTAGCAAINVPNYIQDKHIYEKKVYSDYEKTLSAVKNVLQEEGWQITKEADPGLYEESRSINNPDVKQTLLFAQTYKKSWVGTGKFAQINVYLRSKDKMTELEFRYLVVKNAFVKSFYQYRNDRLVDNLFQRITDYLKQ